MSKKHVFITYLIANVILKKKTIAENDPTECTRFLRSDTQDIRKCRFALMECNKNMMYYEEKLL